MGEEEKSLQLIVIYRYFLTALEDFKKRKKSQSFKTMLKTVSISVWKSMSKTSAVEKARKKFFTYP